MAVKKQSLKTVSLDIEKVSAQIEKKKESVAELQSEIKSLESQLKELNEIKNQLTKESYHQQINTIFTDRNLSNQQLGKLVDVVSMLKKQIDNFDTDDIFEALKLLSDDKKTDNKNLNVTEKNDGEATV